MESQGKLSGTALVIWICTSWRHFELIWALQQMTRLLLLRRGLWCTKGIQFPQAFFTDCIWEKLYRKRARQRWKVALCYPCCHYTLLSDWHFTKKGAPPSIHYCSHWLFFYSFLGPFYTSQGKERVCKKADNKGKINWKLLQILFPKIERTKASFLIRRNRERSINFCKSFVFVPIWLESFAFSGYLKTFLFRSS